MRLNSPSGLCYLLENGIYLFLFIPALVGQPGSNQFLKNVFGVEAIQQIQTEAVRFWFCIVMRFLTAFVFSSIQGLPELLTQESQFLHELLNNVTKERRKAMRVYIVRQGIDKVESVFRSFLYEDKKTHMSATGGK